MAVVEELIRKEANGTLSFGNYELAKKEKLSDFEYEGETVMMAPASGFYSTPGMGKDEVRIAYVLNKTDLKRAVFILEKALEAYNSQK